MSNEIKKTMKSVDGNTAAALASNNFAQSLGSINSTFWSSCEVLNPSKKWQTGTSDLIAIKCAREAKSATSCTEWEHNIVMPVWRIA